MTGASLRLAAWIGQTDARANWEKEVAEPGSTANATGVFTRLSFPARGREFFVLDGASRANLLLGPAHIEGTGTPGANGNFIVAAHRDTHFRILKDLKKGELITLNRRGRTFQYRIVALEVVRPTDNSFYQPTSTPVLTLVTCYPFYYLGRAPKRFIVRAELLESNS
ncbi:MAG: sortase family protein [Bryobacterales bacterium]|nr:sortase family protein [Bryobacterales bacterium]